MNTATKLKTEAIGPLVLQESFRDTCAEAMPLIRQHGQEIGLIALPYPWRPALNLYRDMERENCAIWFSVRDADLTLIGYALYLLCPSTMFSGQTHAILEAIYVRPEHRGVALLRQLWQEGDKILRDRNVVSLSWSVWRRKGGRHPEQVTHWRFF